MHRFCWLICALVEFGSRQFAHHKKLGRVIHKQINGNDQHLISIFVRLSHHRCAVVFAVATALLLCHIIRTVCVCVCVCGVYATHATRTFYYHPAANAL